MHSMCSRQAVRNLLFALPLTALTVGCGGEPLEQPTDTAPVAGDESPAQVEQGVALGGTYWWGTSTNGFTSTAIGTATNRTCFLSGVQGNLVPRVTGSWSGTGTFISGGNWTVYVSQNNSKALSTGIQCLATAANRTAEVSWYQGSAAKLLGAATAQRRCFLTSIEASGGFNSNSDYVRVWSDGLNWYLGGNLAGDGGGSAVCVDVPENHGGWLWVAGDPGGFTENLAYNPDSVACLLSGIGGHFNTSSYTDGVSIDYNAGTRFWEMTVVNGKRGWGNCVK
ncbi:MULTISPECIES: hypothetical protein [Myxococcus]|nr:MULTISPECIES: hypothetical protein [Myxococcus]